MNKQISTFTEGKIFAPLMRFALPVLAALFLQSMYGAVDTLIVGQFADAAGVSAVSTGSQLMATITFVIVGIAMGTTVMIGQSIGEGNKEKADAVAGTSVALFAVIGLLFAIGVQPLAEPLARLLKAPEEAFEGTVEYVRICAAGMVFIVAYNLIGSVFRGIGNSRLPLITVAIACVVNIFGDLLMVAVFKMGAAGAAIATVFAQGVSVALSLIIIKKQGMPFKLTRANIRFDKKLIGGIFKLGAPIAMQDLLVSASFLVITTIVNNIGLIESAGLGVAERVCGFVMLVPSAFSQSMSAFVAQNIGARRVDRAKKALWCGICASLAVGVFMGYFSFFHGELLTGIFTNDAAVALSGADYLKAYAIDTIFTSFMFCFSGYFNGCGRTTFVMAQGIVGAFLVRIPVSYIMSGIAPVTLFKIGLATPASTLVQIFLCVGYFIILNRKQKLMDGQL